MRKFNKRKRIASPSIKKTEVIGLDNKKLRSICFQKLYFDTKWYKKINNKEVGKIYFRQIWKVMLAYAYTSGLL